MRDDHRLIAALQCDPRVPAERLASVLAMDSRAVRRRLRALLDGGTVSVAVSTTPADDQRVMMLRIKVLRGKVDAIASALAARDDIPYIDLASGGDEFAAVLVASSADRDRLVFRQLPATTAITSVDAQTVIHVYSDSSDWRLDALTAAERAALTTARPRRPLVAQLDQTDLEIVTALQAQPRASAAVLAASAGRSESTVRRRLAELRGSGQLVMQAFVEPHRLGLNVDAALWMKVRPGNLDAVGHVLAAHPAVHGALATTGSFNLYAAVWLRDLDHLYEFVTVTLAGLDIDDLDSVIIGRAIKRPGL